MKVGPAMPVPADSFSTCPTHAITVFLAWLMMRAGNCRCSPNFRATFPATRDIDLYPPLALALSLPARPVSSANPTTNTAKCAMGTNHCIVWSEHVGRPPGFFSPRRLDERGRRLAVVLQATFKGPNLKSSAYTRSAWLAAACSAL